jgi:hypothetical protein
MLSEDELFKQHQRYAKKFRGSKPKNVSPTEMGPARPRYERVDRRVDRSVQPAIGPITKISTVATQEANRYTNIYEHERREYGQYGSENERRAKFFVKLTRDLSTLKQLLNQATVDAFKLRATTMAQANRERAPSMPKAMRAKSVTRDKGVSQIMHMFERAYKLSGTGKSKKTYPKLF